MRTKLLVLTMLLLFATSAVEAAQRTAQLRVVNKTSQSVFVRFTHHNGSRSGWVGARNDLYLKKLELFGRRTLIGLDAQGNRLFSASTNFFDDKRATIYFRNGKWKVEFMGD